MWKVVTHWVTINDLKIGNDKEEYHFQTEKVTSHRQITKHIKKQIKEKELEGINEVSFNITRIKE